MGIGIRLGQSQSILWAWIKLDLIELGLALAWGDTKLLGGYHRKQFLEIRESNPGKRDHDRVAQRLALTTTPTAHLSATFRADNIGPLPVGINIPLSNFCLYLCPTTEKHTTLLIRIRSSLCGIVFIALACFGIPSSFLASFPQTKSF